MSHWLRALLLVAGLAPVPAGAQPASEPGQSGAQTAPAAATAPPAAVDYLFPDLAPDALVYDGKHVWFRPVFAWVGDYTSLSQDEASLKQVGKQDDTKDFPARAANQVSLVGVCAVEAGAVLRRRRPRPRRPPRQHEDVALPGAVAVVTAHRRQNALQ